MPPTSIRNRKILKMNTRTRTSAFCIFESAIETQYATAIKSKPTASGCAIQMRSVTRSALDGSKKKREIEARMEEMPIEPKMTAMTIRRTVKSRMMREMNRLKVGSRHFGSVAYRR